MIRRILLAAILVLASLVVLGGAALQTAWLRDLVLASALDAATDDWSVGATRGRLLSGLELDALRIERDGLLVEIAAFEVRPDLGRLVLGEAALAALRVEGVRVVLPPAEAPSDPDADPTDLAFTTPVPVAVRTLELRDVRVDRDGARLVQLGRLDTTLSLRDDELALTTLDLRLAAPVELRVAGDAALRLAPGLPLTLGADLTMTLPEASPMQAEGAAGDRLVARVELDGSVRALDGTVRTRAPVDARLTLRGVDALGPSGDLELTLLAPASGPDLRIDALDLEASGQPDAWRLAARGTLRAGPEDAPTVDVDLEGRGDLERAEIDRLAVDDGGNVLVARGAADLEAPWRFRATLDGDDLDAGRWLEAWPSRLDIDAEIAGTAAPVDVDLQMLRVAGRWNDEPARVDAAARVRVDDDGPTVDLRRLDIELGGNRVAHVASPAAGAFDFEVDAPRLAALWPGLRGALDGRVTLRDPTAAPVLDVDLTGRGVGYEDIGLGRLRAAGRLVPSAPAESSLTLDGAELRIGDETVVDVIDLDVTGAGDVLRGTLAILGSGREIRLGADYAHAPDRPASLRIDALELLTPEAGDWSLEAGSVWSLALEAGAVTFEATCLRSQDARLCVDAGRAGADGTEAVARLSDFDLVRLDALLPGPVTLTGPLAATVRVDGALITAEADASDARFSVDDDAGELLFEDRLTTARVEARRADGRTVLRAELVGALAGRAFVDATVDEAEDDEPRLEATVDLGIDDLRPFSPLVPELRDLSGTATGKLRLSGAVGDPSLGGSIEATVTADVVPLGTRLDPLTVRLDGSGTEGLALEAVAMFEGEPLRVDGVVDLVPGGGVRLDATVRGDEVLVLALEQTRARISPDLRVRVDGPRVAVSGQLAVPRASVEFTRLPESSETLSRDVVVHDETRGTVERGTELDLDLEIAIGPEVTIRAAGAEATLAGSLNVQQRPGGALEARGRIDTLRGDIARYGETLELRRGRIAFDGPIDNPSVDVLAARTVGEYEVGLRVSGYVSNLQTRLYSSPPTDDAQTLTMLVSGRVPGQASGADLAKAEQAAIGLGLGGAASVLGRLTDRLGIDEFGVEDPMDEDSGAVVVGKQLTPGLYARYTYGLHSRAGGVILEYEVSESIAIRSEAGVTQAVDVLFQREFD